MLASLMQIQASESDRADYIAQMAYYIVCSLAGSEFDAPSWFEIKDGNIKEKPDEPSGDDIISGLLEKLKRGKGVE